ncbi:MAG: hypothetical protein ACRD2Y_16555 [Terriglobales bacterium]
MSKMVSRVRKTFRWMAVALVVALLSAGLAMGAHASAKPAPKPATKKPTASSSTRKKVTAGKSRKRVASKKVAGKHSRRARRGAWKRRGQQAIDGQRIRQIQEALVREKYLTGEPTGTWDDRSRQAMIKYHQDNGWQTKVLPDSRALIKLGLGPTYAGINPESLPAAEHSAPAGKNPATKNPAPAPLPAAGVLTKPQP